MTGTAMINDKYYGMSVDDIGDLHNRGDQPDVIQFSNYPPTHRWQNGWREHIAPKLSHEALEAMRAALTTDSPFWQQGRTTMPIVPDHAPAACACLIGIGGWKGEGIGDVGKLQLYFERIVSTPESLQCHDDDSLDSVAEDVRAWIRWHDETDRQVVRQTMLVEVHAELNRRLEDNYMAARAAM